MRSLLKGAVAIRQWLTKRRTYAVVEENKEASIYLAKQIKAINEIFEDIRKGR